MLEAFAVSPSGAAKPAAFGASATTPTRPKPRAKVTRKDRAKRLLLSLATKHHFHSTTGTGEIAAAERSSEQSLERRSPGGVADPVPSPLVTATDAATVRPGMVLASVSARGGQGVSEEAVDTWGMGVKEAIETLVRCDLLSVLFRAFGVTLAWPGVVMSSGVFRLCGRFWTVAKRRVFFFCVLWGT